MKLIEKQLQLTGSLTVGRPPTPARDILDGVLWILRTGARRKDPPREFAPYQTCHRRYQK